jgi:hypothetical protein
MAKESYNVQNTVTGELISVNSIAVEYDTQTEAMTAAIYYTGVTGQQHIVVGPHPRPHA